MLSRGMPGSESGVFTATQNAYCRTVARLVRSTWEEDNGYAGGRLVREAIANVQNSNQGNLANLEQWNLEPVCHAVYKFLVGLTVTPNSVVTAILKNFLFEGASVPEEQGQVVGTEDNNNTPDVGEGDEELLGDEEDIDTGDVDCRFRTRFPSTMFNAALAVLFACKLAVVLWYHELKNENDAALASTAQHEEHLEPLATITEQLRRGQAAARPQEARVGRQRAPPRPARDGRRRDAPHPVRLGHH